MDVLEKKVPIPVKTYKDVEQEIENQYLFAKSSGAVSNANGKSDFLKKIGFGGSETTRSYKTAGLIEKYESAYSKRYKFITEDQIDAICEKFDLYVRDLIYFEGKIPDKNVVDLMNCWVDPIHVFEDINWVKKNITRGFEFWYNAFGVPMINVRDCKNHLSIIANKSMFSKQALYDQRRFPRIFVKDEKPAQSQVELDPIVLCKVEGGYLILTAWGDESNDELVANHNFN